MCLLTANCAEGDVKLSGGRNDSVGQLEVCIQGSYSRVCYDSSWSQENVKVICRQINPTYNGEL